MSEGTSDIGEITGNQGLQIGDSVTAFTYPLTEGLIIARAVTDESKLELSIIVAPHKKRGQAWSRASVVSRDASKLSKKMPSQFSFPIKNVEILRLEARNAKGDPAWAFATCVALDRQFCGKSYGSGVSDSDELNEEERMPNTGGMITKQSENQVVEIRNKEQGAIEARVEEVLQLKEKEFKTVARKGKKYNDTLSDSDFMDKEKQKRKSRRRRRRKVSTRRRRVVSSSEYSDSSSSTSSDSSRNSAEVGEKGRSGKFTCPFHENGNRGFKDIRLQIKGQAVGRKNVRIALHNLYAEYNTMKSFADSLISQANASPFKPFSSDTAWLTAYARNIDAILLRSLGGPWSTWNEPVLDEMLIGFLDLVVRVSPNKEYPICLDDCVRKWMRKKRVGANAKFGPVSYSLQHAKFTEFGPVVFQSGWNKQRERNYGRAATTPSYAKGTPNGQGGGEKKPPPAAQPQ